jgi:hypothetical protein
MKIIINTDFGGFGLSQKAFELYKQRAGIENVSKNKWDVDYRDDPIMVSIVEELGEEADDHFSRLEIREIPDEYDYDIGEYDGWEHVVLRIKESRLRELIRIGDEDAIVKYVKKTQTD